MLGFVVIKGSNFNSLGTTGARYAGNPWIKKQGEESINTRSTKSKRQKNVGNSNKKVPDGMCVGGLRYVSGVYSW